MTPEAEAALEGADDVLYLVAEAGTAVWIERTIPSARSLHPHYRPGLRRREIYEAIVEEILAPVREGRRVCAALYGHPGVFSQIGHEAIRRARAEGFDAEMLPAVSAADCLFAELGVDPGAGCQMYEATDFLLYRREVDTTAALILWQISAIGEADATTEVNRDGLATLAERLQELYSDEHEVTLYEASPYPVADSRVQRIPLAALAEADVGEVATLYVPPERAPEPDPAALERLGLSG